MTAPGKRGTTFGIPVADVTNVVVADGDTEVRRTPGWAVALAIVGALFFLLGLLFLLVKETRRVPRASVTVYTASQAFLFTIPGLTGPQAHAAFYPLIAATAPRPR